MRRKEHGVIIAEFAAVLPVIIFLALIVAEGANMFRIYQVVDNAAREGARLSILPANYFQALNALGNGKGKTFSNPQTCTFTASSKSSIFPVCQDVANYMQNNTAIGTLVVQCPTVTVDVNQMYAPESDTSTSHYSRVAVSCAYALKYLPRLSFFSVARTMNIKRTATFLNFY